MEAENVADHYEPIDQPTTATTPAEREFAQTRDPQIMLVAMFLFAVVEAIVILIFAFFWLRDDPAVVDFDAMSSPSVAAMIEEHRTTQRWY